ncbi:MAG: tyrosine protein phosphatase [Chloroflexi bacterium]|nr:tyrosine protein phosphatase [Chloroflexota bacterium]
MPFIDLHSHVLPGVDDGPKSWDDTMRMLRRAAQGGTGTIVATPHSRDRASWEDIATLRRLCDQANETLGKERLPLTVVLGMENSLLLDTAKRVQAGAGLTYNGSRYVLVELPFLQLPLYWEEELFQLQLQDYIPLIAHPERQAQIQERPEFLAPVVERGMLAQVTAGSLTGVFGSRVKKVAERLVAKGLVQVIASDCHVPDGPRNPDLADGVWAAAKLIGEKRALAMATAVPQAILSGQPLPKPD